MKNKYILLFIFNLLMFSLSAQTLDQARAWLKEGEYEKAKPVFEKFLKTQPNNGNYNLWYGISCLKTGDPQQALSPLKVAVQKRVPSGQLYLAETYSDLYMFENAVETYEAYIADLKKKKRDTEEVELALEKCKVNLRYIKNVEQVCIIDSIIVDKANFLSVYQLSPETGKIYTYDEFFNTSSNPSGVVYETERKNKIYFGQQSAKEVSKIFTRNKLGDEWGPINVLPERVNNISGDTNYPFMMGDGITIYFASNGDQSTGGYDIFVTRYNSTSDTYLAPENIGMPFNSPYNDYMYVIDEFNNLGWFASDRYQPEDSVCIYVFIPNESKQTYNYENMELSDIINFAKINSIRATWKDEQTVVSAQNRLEKVFNQTNTTQPVVDFTFVINDKRTYNYFSQFKSTTAQALFKNYQQKEKDLEQQQAKLQNLREQYIKGSAAGKDKLKPSILDLEKRIITLQNEVDSLEIEVRNAEIKITK